MHMGLASRWWDLSGWRHKHVRVRRKTVKNLLRELVPRGQTVPWPQDTQIRLWAIPLLRADWAQADQRQVAWKRGNQSRSDQTIGVQLPLLRLLQQRKGLGCRKQSVMHLSHAILLKERLWQISDRVQLWAVNQRGTDRHAWETFVWSRIQVLHKLVGTAYTDTFARKSGAAIVDCRHFWANCHRCQRCALRFGEFQNFAKDWLYTSALHLERIPGRDIEKFRPTWEKSYKRESSVDSSHFQIRQIDAVI